jgi:hypothetical protein
MARYTFDLRCLTETVFDGGCAVGQVRTVKYKQEPVAVLLGETGPPPADSTSTDGAISSSDTNPTLFRGRRPRWRPCRRPNFLEQLQSWVSRCAPRQLFSPARCDLQTRGAHHERCTPLNALIGPMMKPRTCLARYSPFIVVYPTTHRQNATKKKAAIIRGPSLLLAFALLKLKLP